jgi:acetylornithine deacetylase/succinyl-diaminopimelate desuccinylase-like protein
MQRALAYARRHGPRFVQELTSFLRFPSIASEPAQRADLVRCAIWLRDHLRALGLRRARLVEAGGAPFVCGERLEAPGLPSVLIYGHYDVQSAGSSTPEAWHSPPFEPTVRGAHLYARGASDDKGQLFAHVKAIESWLASGGRLPVNVRCLFDGEEEIGSPSLGALIDTRRAELCADVAVISDMPMRGLGLPAITYGMRGALQVDIELCRAGNGLHSGLYGGAVANPVEALCEIVSALRLPSGAVAIPGFYADVAEVSDAERDYLRRHDSLDPAAVADPHRHGERGLSPIEQATIRPALTVNALHAGASGSGNPASIPTFARAKLDIRLVPRQEPAKIERELRRFLGARLAPGVRCRVRRRGAVRPFLLDREHWVLYAAKAAYRLGFGVEPTVGRSGGTLPAATLLQEELGLPVALMGFALPDDRAHGSDERLHLPTFHRGIATAIAFLAEVERCASRQRNQRASA